MSSVAFGSLRKYRVDNFPDPLHHVSIIGHRLSHRHLTSPAGCDFLSHEQPGINQKPCGHSFLQSLVPQIAYFFPQFGQIIGQLKAYPAFMGNDSLSTCLGG